MNKLIPLDSSSTFAADLAAREFVEDHKIHYGTVVPVTQSSLANTTVPNRASAALAVFLSEQTGGGSPRYAGVTDFQKVALVYFRGTNDLDRDAQLVRLVQIPLYYEEIKPYTPIEAADLALRQQFANMTGYVMIGPDECVAVLRKRPGQDHVFCDVYENNDLGVVRDKAGVYAETVDYHAVPQQIRDLNVTQTDKALSTWMGEVFWWSPQTALVSPLQISRMRETVRLLEAHRPAAPFERRNSGAVVHRSFISNGSVNSPELGRIRGGRPGWRRYPTSQDAWYFSVWMNPIAMEMLSYCEQDVAHVVCSSQEQFQQELADMARFHGRNLTPSMLAIGPDGTTAGFDCMSLLGGDGDQIKTVVFDVNRPAKDANDNWICPLMGELKLTHPDVAGLSEGESIALDDSAFQVNLLDPRRFDQQWQASLSRIDGALVVTLSSLVGDHLTEHRASFELEALAA